MKPIYNAIREKYQNHYLFKRDINGNVIYWTADVYDARKERHDGRRKI